MDHRPAAAHSTGRRTNRSVGRSELQFRAEAFNVLNRTNFGAPNGNASSPAFGTITSTYDPRQVQLGVRVTF